MRIEGEISQPAPEVLAKAVDGLVAEYPARDVALHLHAFASQPGVHWVPLAERLEKEANLKFEDHSGV